MNDLKEAREIAGLTQKQLAAMVQDVDPRIDGAMISKFETEACFPTAIVAEALARCLQTSMSNLFGEVGQMYILLGNAPETPVEPLPFVVEDLLNSLSETPKTRKQLCEELDISDRHLRELISKARKYGYSINNTGKGDGYYLSLSKDEMTQFYRKEYGRAMSILKNLKKLRTQLKAWGVPV